MSQSPTGHDKIQDSLDNLSNLKLKQSSLDKQRLELIQLKQRFVSLLQKLQTPETRQISLNQLKKLVEQHRQSDHLKIYLSILKTLKPDNNSTTKQHQVLVISIIAKAFNSNLIDPTDKQPSLLKTCFKVIEISLAFFNDHSNTVQQACARVLLDLNEFCLEEGKYPKQQKLSILFAPLTSILKNGVDKASQATATVCINELIKFWYANHAKEYLDLVAKEVFNIILKINSEYHEIFMAAIVLIEHKGITFFENRLPNFVSKILPIIDGTRQTANSLNSYMCKVNVCKILQKIASLLTPDERQRLADLNIINSLTKAARNKIIQVQTAATRAIKVWKGESVSVQKPQRSSKSIGKPLRSLEQIRDQKKRQRSNSKEHTIKIETQLEYMKEDLEKMVKGGWGANNRAKQYVKRGSGVGGGHYGQVQTTPPKSTKSHREHLEELRSLVKKGSKQNKNIDKFSDFAVPESKLNQQVPTTSNNNVKVFMQQNHRGGASSPESNQLPVNSNPKRNNFIHENNDFEVEEDEGDQMVNLGPKSKLKSLPANSSNKNQKESSQVERKRSSFINEDHDFEVEEDEGDQMVNLGPKSKISNPLVNSSSKNQKKANHGERKNSQSQSHMTGSNFQLNEDEMREILQQEESLAQGDSLTLGLKKDPEPKQKQQAKPVTVTATAKDQKLVERVQKKRQDLGQSAGLMSPEEMEQMMLDSNMSDMNVDVNFDDIREYMNESEFPTNDKNKVKKSAVQQRLDLPNTLTRKPSQKFDESLNYTESQISKFKESVTKKNSRDLSIPNSPPKTGGGLKEQFTLNPNSLNSSKANKFQSIQEARDQDLDEEIEEIFESCYQESRSKQENIFPLKAKAGGLNQKQSAFKEPSKQVSLKQLIQREEEPEEVSKNYQELIQNPPRLYDQPKHLDRKSMIKEHAQNNGLSSVTSEGVNEEETEEEQETVTDKWIRILSLVENNEINLAFEEAILLDDPIYLLRLLIMTRTPISSLTAENCSNLWAKFLGIYQHNFISIMFVQMFSQAQDLNLIKNSLTIEEMHELMVKLYEVSGTSKGKLSFNAAQLYNKVDESLKPNQKG